MISLFAYEVDSTIHGLRYSLTQEDLLESPVKEGIATLSELEASDMSSPLYTRDDNVNRMTTVVLQSYLYIDESGYYAFRVRSNNPNDVDAIHSFHVAGQVLRDDRRRSGL